MAKVTEKKSRHKKQCLWFGQEFESGSKRMSIDECCGKCCKKHDEPDHLFEKYELEWKIENDGRRQSRKAVKI